MTGMNPAEFANIAHCERDFWWYRGMRAILFRLLDPWLDGRKISLALEAGCGTGFLSRLLEKERGWPVVAMDLSGEGLRFAQKMGAHRPVQGDICRLPFGENAFDLALSMDVLVHLPRRREDDAARELARVLRPGGLVAIRAAAFELFRSRHSDFVGEVQRFTRRRLREAFAGAGFRVLRCTYANTLLSPVALAKFRLWEPLVRAPLASGVQPMAPWMNRLLHAPLSLEAAWIGSGRNFPAGQSVFLIGEKR